MADDKCLVHAESIAMLQGDTHYLKANIQTIKEDVANINKRIDRLSRVEYKNGGGMPSSTDLSSFLEMIYTSVKKMSVTKEQMLNDVQSNIEEIVKIADEYRATKQDKKTIQWNNKMQFMMFIIAFISVLVNIVLFIHIGK